MAEGTRRLILMRHAKSSWKSGAATDHARPLNKRGRKAAPKVGAELARRGWVPDVVISSDSARTTETWERMREALGYDGEARFSDDLYHGGIEEVRGELRRLDAGQHSVLLLGHNPGWEEVLAWLCGRDEAMKTGCAALLSVDRADWAEAADAEGDWTLHDMICPRDL